jgi:hypothetical protein
MEVRLGHTVPLVGLGDGAATRESGERCIDVVPQEEQYVLPHDWRVKHWEVKVGINSKPESDQDVHTAQDYCFYVRALL